MGALLDAPRPSWWTCEEIARAKEFRAQGKVLREIAAELGRSPVAIRLRLRKGDVKPPGRRKKNDSRLRQKQVTDEDRRALATRRRIEDIKEASRLEREALDEVWDRYKTDPVTVAKSGA